MHRINVRKNKNSNKNRGKARVWKWKGVSNWKGKRYRENKATKTKISEKWKNCAMIYEYFVVCLIWFCFVAFCNVLIDKSACRQMKANYAQIQLFLLIFAPYCIWIACVAWLLRLFNMQNETLWHAFIKRICDVRLQSNKRAFPASTGAPVSNVHAKNKSRAFSQNCRFAATPHGTFTRMYHVKKG